MLIRQEGARMKMVVAICVVALVGVAYASDAAITRAPIVKTGAASAGDWFAILQGTVDPNQEGTTVWFEWGPTPERGTATVPQAVHPGGEAEIGENISPLESFKTYYFLLVAENASGRAFSETVAFVTLDTIPPAPACLVSKVVGRPFAEARALIR